jgi:hypothetical protein
MGSNKTTSARRKPAACFYAVIQHRVERNTNKHTRSNLSFDYRTSQDDAREPVRLIQEFASSQRAASAYRQGRAGSSRVDRPCSHGASQRLEPDEGKLSRPVLRGGSGSNAALLPDLKIGRFTRAHRLCATMLSPNEATWLATREATADAPALATQRNR